MRLRQVEAFRATMTTGTITGAAHYMSLTQPSVSRLISDLEANLGFRLFERRRGRLHPTAEALRFYQEVERAFTGLDQLEHVAERIRDEQTGHLTVHSAPALSTTLIPRALKRFHEYYPDAKVSLEVRAPFAIFDRLQAHATDVAITNRAAELPGVVQDPLIDAAFVCAIPEGHHLAKKDVITPQDLNGESIIGLTPEGPLNWNLIFNTLNDAGIEYKSWVSTQRAYTTYSLVAEGLGIGIFEPFSARNWLQEGVVIRPFRPKITFSFAICFPANKMRSAMARDFAQMVQDQLRDHPPPCQED